MASSQIISISNNDSSLKILNLYKVSPSPSPPTNLSLSLPLTFFDLLWLKFPPVERLFFYSLPHLETSHFLDSILPNLKLSLSLTLSHFLPLSGRLLWPPHSSTPFIQYGGDGDGDHNTVSLAVAQSDSNFNLLLSSSRDASLFRPLIPHLDSSDSSASLFSLQITLFPDYGFSIGISTHHAVLDGKSSSMFMKSWSHLSQKRHHPLSSSIEPFFNREAIIHKYSDLSISYIDSWKKSKLNRTFNNNQPSLKILYDIFRPMLDHSVRATFEMTRADLEKLKKNIMLPLSTFEVTTAYVAVCIAKAIEKIEKNKKRFVLSFTADCRGRMKMEDEESNSVVGENYFGNCVMLHLTEEFSEEDGVLGVAKIIQKKVREILGEKGVLDGADTILSKMPSMRAKGIEVIGVSGSNRFGFYASDFGWGRPEKVEIASVDRGLTMGITESKDGNGGVEVGLVLNRKLMDCFDTLFRTEKEKQSL